MAVRSLQAEVETAMQAVRSSPEAIEPRMALFQLAAVTGNWARARSQLETMARLDAECAVLARTYMRLIDAEAVRGRVFAGEEQPVVFGAPPAWLAMTARALALNRTGDAAGAHALRETAREATPARGGTLDGSDFAWIADADPRIGAALEVVIDGQYRWLPFEHLVELRARPPKAMRDLVWQPVTLVLANGSELAAFIPGRYPGSEGSGDDAIRLARETRWVENGTEQWGLGQRLLSTDQDDYALLDVRRLRLADSAAGDDG
jgi:type VI secretion system protein ImpE